jgi:methylenetetrahydrofolate reductase (NADPH)
VTVTASAPRGLEPTLALAERLAGSGFQVVPHISARLVPGVEELGAIVARLRERGIRRILVIAGDVREPAGEFPDAASLLAVLGRLDHGFEEIDIAGYPESHPFISDDATIEAMYEKEPHATHLVSQVCFDAETIGRWVQRVRRRGVSLPVYVGIPGVVDPLRLLRISRRIGVGESARFLGKHANWIARLLLPRTYRPDGLLDGLATYVAVADNRIEGLHVYTFNEVAKTEGWRQATMERLRRAP